MVYYIKIVETLAKQSTNGNALTPTKILELFLSKSMLYTIGIHNAVLQAIYFHRYYEIANLQSNKLAISKHL